jgi:hypothetical protein
MSVIKKCFSLLIDLTAVHLLFSNFLGLILLLVILLIRKTPNKVT